jgi:methanogenic corrinoid protein MtbC1
MATAMGAKTKSGVAGQGVFRGSINDLIQAEIIPRLLVAHPLRGGLASPSSGAALDSLEVANFSTLPLVLEADELMDVVEGFMARGVSAETLYVDLLAPSARKLGQYWEEDACDFVDVTMGLWRLQEVMREIALRSPPCTRDNDIPNSALFSPMPGEQHSFGALMIEEVFARAGWQTEVLIEPQRRELLQQVAERSFDLVGLTVSCDCPSGTLAGLVTAIRSVSKLPSVRIFIGGRVVNANPGLAAEVGADGTAPDARSALALAEQKVGEAKRLSSTLP